MRLLDKITFWNKYKWNENIIQKFAIFKLTTRLNWVGETIPIYLSAKTETQPNLSICKFMS